MPRIPSRIQLGTFGTRNPAAHGRTIAPAITPRGAAQAEEMLAQVEDAPTRRALQALQQSVARATSQARASPFAYAVLLQGVTLLQGGANGANPNPIAHGLGVPASGYIIAQVFGGYVTGHARIPNASNIPPSLIQVWTAWTAFAGVTAPTADLIIYA